MRDKTGRWLGNPTTARMTREQFAARFDHFYAPSMSPKLRAGILDSAREVEGGCCFWEIMGPYAEAMYGDAAEAITGEWW